MSELDREYELKLINQVQAWERANEFLNSEVGQWFINTILGTLNDKAIELMAIAKTEDQRMLAQQTLLASREPKKLLDALISQGKFAKESLLTLPPKEDENG